MNRYRVEYFVNDKLVVTIYCSAWSRFEASVEARSDPRFPAALELARQKSTNLTWDATIVSQEDPGERPLF